MRRARPARGAAMSARVLIGGGGVAAVEAALALRECAPGLVDVTFVAPNAEFALPPETVAEATGGPPASRHSLREIADDIGAELVEGAIVSVNPDARAVVTDYGGELAYD